MDNYISASEYARRNKKKITRQSLSRWLIDGRVPGAVKVANMWLIPSDLDVEDIDVPKMGRPKKRKGKVTNGVTKDSE